jgi:hypothetical protein
MKLSFASVAGGLLLVTYLALPADAQHFFPARPRNVLVSRTTGILTRYSIGNGTGEFSTEDRLGRSTDFYLAYPTRIGGRVYDCEVPRQPGMRFDPTECKQWPANVVIGTTEVRITYWWMVFPGTHERVRVSDTIDPAS